MTVQPGSRLRYLVERDRLPVNSMHHQGIKALAGGLVASAMAPDGLIEAAESSNGHFLLGVQWHPEVFDVSDPHTRQLFRGFVEAAERWEMGEGRLARA